MVIWELEVGCTVTPAQARLSTSTPGWLLTILGSRWVHRRHAVGRAVTQLTPEPLPGALSGLAPLWEAYQLEPLRPRPASPRANLLWPMTSARARPSKPVCPQELCWWHRACIKW